MNQQPVNAAIQKKLATLCAAVAVLTQAGIEVTHIDIQDTLVRISVAYCRACPRFGARRLGPAHCQGQSHTRFRAKVCGALVDWLEPA